MKHESKSAYPVVEFLVSRGKDLAFALAAAVLLSAVGFGAYRGALWLIPTGAVLSVVLLGLLLSYVEVLRIIADTLIPKY